MHFGCAVSVVPYFYGVLLVSYTTTISCISHHGSAHIKLGIFPLVVMINWVKLNARMDSVIGGLR